MNWEKAVNNTTLIKAGISHGSTVYANACKKCNEILPSTPTNDRQLLGNEYQTIHICDECGEPFVVDQSKDWVIEWYFGWFENKFNHLKTFENFCLNEEKDSKLKNAGVEGFNKPKRTPNHPTKSHIVVAKEGDKTKLIRFGEQGAKTAGKPKEGESEKMKNKRKSFKARHGKNIKKGKMSAAYWADKVKW